MEIIDLKQNSLQENFRRYIISIIETFAPIIRINIRVLLAMIAHYNLEYHQVDINSAFTESDLDEIIYLSVLNEI